MSLAGGKTGKRFLFVSQVGLGTIRKYTSEQFDLSSAPEVNNNIKL